MNLLTVLINLALLLLLGYSINKVEKSGSLKEKTANRNALALTTKSIILFATLEIIFQLINYFGYFVGLMSSLRNAGGDLTIDLFLLIVVYFCSFYYYQKPEAEQEKLKASLFGQMFTKGN